MADMDTALIAFVAFIFAGLVKGVLGFGFPIIALVVLTLAIGLFDALAIIVIPTLATNLLQALSGNFLREIFCRMGVYFLTAMCGIFVSSFYIADVDVNLLTGLLGAVLFFFSLSRLFDLHITIRRNQEPLLSVFLGTVNGLLTGFTGSFMVPSVLYMQALGFSRDMLVQAMGVYFGLSTLMLAVSLGRNDLISSDQAILSLIALLPSFAGVFAGRWIRQQVDEKYFQRLFLASVLILGAYIVIRALVSL